MTDSEPFRRPAELMRRYGLRAKKKWGQNFLHDVKVARAIVRASTVGADDTVVEIGAGLGAITGLLASAARRVVAIERDRELAEVLRREFEGVANVEIREQNALNFDFAALDEPAVEVVGNLPYNISSPLIFHLIDQRAHIRCATVMLQRELAQRLVASPGSRLYGAPSVSCRQFAELKLCLQVGRGAFAPPPRVDSSVIQLCMRHQPLCQVDPRVFREVVRAAFGARRKTLRRALAAAYPADRVERALKATGISPTVRAETLDVAQFGNLANALTSAESENRPDRLPERC
jgi:16S rRNA (adenine1518-N6/adenine1519-N6)-dimethyltransferase